MGGPGQPQDERPEEPSVPKDQKSPVSLYVRGLRSAGPLFGSGIQFAAAVLLMFFLGKWGDDAFDTSPWLMLTGVVIGFGAGLVTFIRTVTRAAGRGDSARNEKEH